MAQSRPRSHPALNSDFLATVALAPGVYLMKGEGEEVLYVGKAKSLRKRLSSYLRQAGEVHTKTAALLARVVKIETILTHTEKEALILEASLIKKHRPKYNVILRDDKNYPLLKVTVQEEWPRLVMTRKRTGDGARYFGPFSSPAAMWQTIRYLQSLFPLRSCRESKFSLRTRPCLNFQLKKCLAPCVGLIDRPKYLEMVGNILLFLEGKNQQLTRELEKQMKEASEAMQYEEAARLRDQIQAFRETLEKQQVIAPHRLDQDIFALAREGERIAVSVIFVRRGTVYGHQSFYLSHPLGSDPEILAEAVSRFYGEDRPVPREVLTSLRLEHQAVIADWLTDRRGSRVTVRAPERGGGAGLVRMAAANAAQVLTDRRKKAESWTTLAAEIGKGLGLRRPPNRIQCADISNISGTLAVGSLVAFENGAESRKDYRHYRIKQTSGPDDYAMMAESLERHFARLKESGELPDLLLVDGGKGQLNVARNIMARLGLTETVELAGIAKEKEGEGEKIYRPGRKNPIVLPGHSRVLLFLMRVRDEAHRFGITFHRRLRERKNFVSLLDELAGIGPARKKALLRTLGSVARVQSATEEELAAVPGISRKLARHIWLFLHEKASLQGETAAD